MCDDDDFAIRLNGDRISANWTAIIYDDLSTVPERRIQGTIAVEARDRGSDSNNLSVRLERKVRNGVEPTQIYQDFALHAESRIQIAIVCKGGKRRNGTSD